MCGLLASPYATLLPVHLQSTVQQHALMISLLCMAFGRTNTRCTISARQDHLLQFLCSYFGTCVQLWSMVRKEIGLAHCSVVSNASTMSEWT